MANIELETQKNKERRGSGQDKKWSPPISYDDHLQKDVETIIVLKVSTTSLCSTLHGTEY